MKKATSILLVTIFALSIIGARLQNTYILYAMLGLVVLFVALAAFGKVSERLYPYALFTIGLSLLYQTTLMSNGLVGTDIHSEYYYYQLALNNGWDFSLAHAYNSCIGSVLIAPAITDLFGIDGIWIFKVIYPFLFAFVSPLLYFVFKKQFGGIVAFLSVFYFISIPVWSLELIGLPRQILGELMLVLCAYLIIVSKWRNRTRVLLLSVCAVSGVLFHYVMGLAIFLYLGIILVVSVFLKKRLLPFRWQISILSLLLLVSLWWFSFVSSGVMMTNLTLAATRVIERGVTDISPVEKELVLDAQGDTSVIINPGTTTKENILDKGTPLIQTAFGMDFADASPSGKVFRVLQYITQFLIVVGCGCILIKRKKYDWEYLGLVFAGVLLLAVCVLVPMSITIIGTSRAYHIGMLFLTPAVILGGRLIFRNLQLFTICLIIPYFIFTSGIVFEAFNNTDISRADIPYSIALSHNRVDMAAVFTDNDINVRDWAVENGCEPMFLDLNGELLFLEKMDTDKWNQISIIDSTKLEAGLSLLPQYASDLPDKCYIYLREWSFDNELMTFKPGWYSPRGEKSGMRVSLTFAELGLDDVFPVSIIIYRKGNAVVYKYDKTSLTDG